MELSDQEKAFIEKYNTETSALDKQDGVKRGVKLTNLFYAWIGFLAVTPMVGITLFLVTMTRFGRSYEESGLEAINSRNDSEALETIDGLQGVQEVVSIYDNRYEIALSVAGAFVSIMVVSILLRVIILATFKGKEANGEEQ